jgi:hypothetical protein
MGPRPDLIGRRVGNVPAGDDRAPLDDPGAFEDVDPDLPPVWVSGTTTVPGATELAIAVNGRIAATTRVDRRRFGALVPPRVLRAGANEIAVLEIADEGFRKL